MPSSLYANDKTPPRQKHDVAMSPAMTRLPDSPDLRYQKNLNHQHQHQHQHHQAINIAAQQQQQQRKATMPELFLDGSGTTQSNKAGEDHSTILNRANRASATTAATKPTTYQQQQNPQQQQQHQKQQQSIRRLRSVAKYNAFHPQAMACSNDTLSAASSSSYEATMNGDDSGDTSNAITSLGAIAGPRGVALFRLSKPHIPLLIFSHTTSSSNNNNNTDSSSLGATATTRRKNKFASKTANNSITSLAFQPTISYHHTSYESSVGRRQSGVIKSNNHQTLYLAAARGSGVLIWDASGHSTNPLLGRLLINDLVNNDSTNNSSRYYGGIGNSGSKNSLSETFITSMSWMPSSSISNFNNPLLATTTSSSLSMWDLRCPHTSGLFQPSLRFANNINHQLTSMSVGIKRAPIVQVACSSCSVECATIDASGVVRIYDLRKTEKGGPVTSFIAHEAGVGIHHMERKITTTSSTCNNDNGTITTSSAWVTWGLDSPMSSATVKVWGTPNSSNEVSTSLDPNPITAILDTSSSVEKDEYWYMGDDDDKSSSQQQELTAAAVSITKLNSISYSSTSNNSTRSNDSNNNDKHNDNGSNNTVSSSSMNYQLIAQYKRSNICCARICPSPITNSLVVVGYLDDKDNDDENNNSVFAFTSSPNNNSKNEIATPSYDNDDTATNISSHGGWWVDVLKLTTTIPSSSSLLLQAPPNRKRRSSFGFDQVVSFAGGAANADVDKRSLVSVLGNADVGKLQAAELAFSSLSSSLLSSKIMYDNNNKKRSTTKADDGTIIVDDKEKKGNTATDKIELLLCCLSDTGIITTTSIPEALPAVSNITFDVASSNKKQNDQHYDPSSSPQRRNKIIRTAFGSTSLNNRAKVFPDTYEGDSLVDVASIWGSLAGTATATATATAAANCVDEYGKNIEQSRLSSPVKHSSAALDGRTTTPASSAIGDSLRSNERRRIEGEGFMPFDMDVSISVAYNALSAANLGLTEMASLSAMINTTGEDGVETTARNLTSVMENIDTERIPCPRLCGAVFGSTGLAVFRNGEVKKMWNWYQKTDTQNLSSIPRGQVDITSYSGPQTIIAPNSEDEPVTIAKGYQTLSSTGPRTLKELMDMTNAAKEAQWGEANNIKEDTLNNAIENFFEEDSLDSNSDDEDEPEHDDDDEDGDDQNETLKNTDDVHFVGGTFSAMKNAQGTTNTSDRSILQRSMQTVGPSSDTLRPTVTVMRPLNERSLNSQGIRLAKGWKFGTWLEHGTYSVETDNSMAHLIPKKEIVGLKTRTMSVPNLSQLAQRPIMEESMTFLGKLFNHQQDGGGGTFSPSDNPNLMRRTTSQFGQAYTIQQIPQYTTDIVRPSTISEHEVKKKNTRLQESEVHDLRVLKHGRNHTHRNELDETRKLCLHNARVSKDCDEFEKENVWNMLAETIQNQIDETGKIFNGWGGDYGGALGVDMINSFFLYYEARHDVQMLATMFCVLKDRHRQSPAGNNHTCLLPKSREKVYDTYIIRYGEILYSWGLLNTRVELNKHLQQRQNEYDESSFLLEEEKKEEASNLGVAFSCPKCNSIVDQNSNYCSTCTDFAFRCSICDVPVRGLFTYCEICKHGGHLRHLVDWFATNSFCPTGCGCQCKFRNQEIPITNAIS